jgi:hypothetical protein
MAYVVSIGEQDQEKQNRSIRNAHERATTIEADLDTLEAAAVTATNAFGTDGRVLISDGTGRRPHLPMRTPWTTTKKAPGRRKSPSRRRATSPSRIRCRTVLIRKSAGLSS